MSAQAKSLRSSLHEREDLLEKYSLLMCGSTERVFDTVGKFGVVFGEVSSVDGNQRDIDTFSLNPIVKAAFGVANVTFNVRTQ